MRIQQIGVVLFLLTTFCLSACHKGVIRTEAMTPEERAAAYAEAASKKAESESESRRIEDRKSVV